MLRLQVTTARLQLLGPRAFWYFPVYARERSETWQHFKRPSPSTVLAPSVPLALWLRGGRAADPSAPLPSAAAPGRAPAAARRRPAGGWLRKASLRRVTSRWVSDLCRPKGQDFPFFFFFLGRGCRCRANWPQRFCCISKQIFPFTSGEVVFQPWNITHTKKDLCWTPFKSPLNELFVTLLGFFFSFLMFISFKWKY